MVQAMRKERCWYTCVQDIIPVEITDIRESSDVTEGITLKGKKKTAPVSEADNDNYEKAMHMLMCSVRDDVLPMIQLCRIPRQAWETLERAFEVWNPSRKFYLCNALSTLKISDEPGALEAYFKEFDGILSQLTSIGAHPDDESIMQCVVNALPDIYDPVVQGLLAQGLPNFNEFSAILRFEENRLHMRGLQKTNEDVLFIRGQQRQNNRFPSRQQQGSRNLPRICHYCGKPGHWLSNCIERHADIKKLEVDRKARLKRQGKIPANILEQEEDTTDIEDHEDYEEDTASDDVLEAAINSLDINTSKDSTWIIDSGAARHGTGQRSALSNLESERYVSSVISAGGQSHPVEGIGNACIRHSDDEIKISNVLYTPEVKRNIMSVRSFVKEGYRVTFDDPDCTLVDKKTNQVRRIGKLDRRTNLWKLNKIDSAFKIEEQNSQVNAISQTEQARLWHQRLAHLNYQSLQYMVSKGLATGIPDIQPDKEVCKPCMQGKQVRERFPKSSVNRATVSLEVIHTDLCGPLKMPSLSGSRYFITMIDDYSRKVWVGFLKCKSEALLFFKNFKQEVENQTGERIKVLRSDKGGEYLSKAFEEFLKQAGIRCFLTTARTLQSNEVAERMNRTLLERARSIMFGKQVPAQLWSEVINTAAYITNRIITRANVDITPDERFTGKKPDLSNIRIFGSRAFIHVADSLRKKLDSKTIEGILIGYDNQSKAYRCYIPASRKIAISRDVKFLEKAEHNGAVSVESETRKEGMPSFSANDATQNTDQVTHTGDKQVIQGPDTRTSSPIREKNTDQEFLELPGLSRFRTSTADVRTRPTIPRTSAFGGRPPGAIRNCRPPEAVRLRRPSGAVHLRRPLSMTPISPFYTMCLLL
jgi:transposase InsO family protein